MTRHSVACVGGGQLAQMLGEAGKSLGVSIRSAGAFDSCSFSSCEPFTKDLKIEQNFNSFIEGIDTFTFESEHEGLEWVNKISEAQIGIYPPAEFVKIAGDRLLERTHLQDLKIPIAPFELIDPEIGAAELDNLLANLVSTQSLSPYGIVVKTRHGGYDGKGQWVIRVGDDTDFGRVATEIFPAISSPGCIVEGLVNFSMECSIIAARSINGEFKSWPLSGNEHQDSILRFSYSPISNLANVKELEIQAIEIAKRLSETNDYVGTLAVECFVTEQGLIVNEIAPRVHNSGHWTIEGSATSQFEQHLRAITGMELGDTSCPGFSAMVNLIGVSVETDAFKDLDGVFLHFYGKIVRPERKVGHITIVAETIEELNERTENVLAILSK